MKMFPIQEAAPVRWELAERAYHEYVKHGGRGQSLERLAERGGFGLQEFACFFHGHFPDARHRECVEKADAVGILLMDLEKDRDDWKSKADELASAVEDGLRRHDAGDTMAIKSNMIRATLAAVREGQ